MFLQKDVNLEKHITGNQKEQHGGNHFSSNKMETNGELIFLFLNKIEGKKKKRIGEGGIFYMIVWTCEKLKVVSY